MTETVTQAVARRDDSPVAMVDRYRDRFAAVLPRHLGIDTFAMLAQGALRDDKLMTAARNDPAAFMTALTHCARLGHEPATEAFYLVPIKGKVEGWEGYRGVVERMYRAGSVASVHAQVVRQGDLYKFEEGMDHPVHQFARFAGVAERGPLVGVYAYARMVTGGHSRVVELGPEEIYQRRDMNPSAKRSDSPWVLWEHKMWLKSAAHDLEAWVPTSREYRMPVQATAVAGRPPMPAQPALGAVPADYVEADADEWPATAQPGGGS